MSDANDSGGVRNAAQIMSFTGSGGEYFGIWIVNILLTIVTLGIYSAWAKVRRNRYFWGNTKLLGQGFDYHAQPKQILIGRIISFVFLVIYNVLINFFPIAGLILALLLLAAIPALVIRGIRFTARMTSYRNVRFGFDGKYWGALKAFVVGPIVSALSLGLLTPFASKWAGRFMMNNLRYGGKKFAAEPPLGKIYRAWLIPAGIAFAGLALLALIGYMKSASIANAVTSADAANANEPSVGLLILVYAVMLALFLIYAFAGLFYRAAVRNIVLNAAALDQRHKLVSTMPRLRFVWISVSNVVATLCTFGLLRPWAAVRMARFQAESTGVSFDGDVGEVFSDIRSDESAVGSEFMDMEGIAIAF